MTDRWTTVQEDLDHWNHRLGETDVHLQQYPYWNEPLRQIRLSPHYLKYLQGGVAIGYVCVLQVGFGPFRVGLVRGGPTSLVQDVPLPAEALTTLVEWGRERGLTFMRFSSTDEELLMRLGTMFDSRPVDPFPFYPHPPYELHIDQLADEQETLTRFQSVARRNIRDATRAGYNITVGRGTDDLRQVSSIYHALKERKGNIYSRPFSSYIELIGLAGPIGHGSVYTASLEGRPLQSALIVRDRDVAHYIIGALDVAALRGRPSPGCLLHWTAMRDFYNAGAHTYDLGVWGSDGLPIFKRKFRPYERSFSGPITVVNNPRMYAVWCRALPALQRIRRPLGRMAGRVSALTQGRHQSGSSRSAGDASP